MAGEDQPLAAAEHREILDIAYRQPELRSLPESQIHAVLVEHDLTGMAHGGGANQALVGEYDDERGVSRIALIDTKHQTVVAVEETTAQFQLSTGEKELAAALSARDDRTLAFLDGREMNPLTRLYFPPNPAPGSAAHRFAIVFLRPSNSERRYAIVDLSARQVVDMLTPEDLTAE